MLQAVLGLRAWGLMDYGVHWREGSKLTPDFWLADSLRRQVLEGLRVGLGKEDEFSVDLVKCKGFREGHPSDQLGMGCAPEVIKCRDVN